MLDKLICEPCFTLIKSLLDESFSSSRALAAWVLFTNCILLLLDALLETAVVHTWVIFNDEHIFGNGSTTLFYDNFLLSCWYRVDLELLRSLILPAAWNSWKNLFFEYAVLLPMGLCPCCRFGCSRRCLIKMLSSSGILNYDWVLHSNWYAVYFVLFEKWLKLALPCFESMFDLGIYLLWRVNCSSGFSFISSFEFINLRLKLSPNVCVGLSFEFLSDSWGSCLSIPIDDFLLKIYRWNWFSVFRIRLIVLIFLILKIFSASRSIEGWVTQVWGNLRELSGRGWFNITLHTVCWYLVERELIAVLFPFVGLGDELLILLVLRKVDLPCTSSCCSEIFCCRLSLARNLFILPISLSFIDWSA